MADHAIEWLASACLLLRIASDDVDVAKDAIDSTAGRKAAAREFDALPYEQRKALVQRVTAHWAANTTAAVKRLWHAAEVLGFDPETTAPDAVALVAATYLSDDVTGLAHATKYDMTDFIETALPDLPDSQVLEFGAPERVRGSGHGKFVAALPLEHEGCCGGAARGSLFLSRYGPLTEPALR